MSRTPVLVLSALTAATLAPACHRGPSTEPPPPPSEAPEVPEVIEWFLGERVRGGPSSDEAELGLVTMGTKTSDRGTNLGTLTANVAAESKGEGTPRPGSCAPGLISFIPVPTNPGVWLGANKTGQLLRYAGERWSPVHSKVALPPIAALLAFGTSASTLELLVVVKGAKREQLSRLTISGEAVTQVQSVDPSTLGDRKETLQRYRSSRCLEGFHDCLRLTSTDEGIVLSSEPRPNENWIIIAVLGKDGVRDVRYADAKGTTVDVLTTQACTLSKDGEDSGKPETPP